MITKKLGKITFGWDPNANKGKGYWYVLGKDESFSRAASATEAMKLGIPKQQDAPKKGASDRRYFGFKTYFDVDKEGRPVRRIMRTGSDYEMADINRSKGLQQLATEKLLSGSSLGGAVKGAIGDRAKSIVTESQRLVDPMNYLSKLPFIGQIAAAYYGKTMGRTAEDISYFTGVRTAGVDQEEMEYMPVNNEQIEEKPKAEKITTPIKTMYRDEKGRFTKAPIDSVDTISEEDKQESETQDKERHEELIDTIKKSYLWGMDSGDVKEDKTNSDSFLLDFKKLLMNLLENIKDTFKNINSQLKNVLTGFTGSGMMMAAIPVAAGIVSVLLATNEQKKAKEAAAAGNITKLNQAVTRQRQYQMGSMGEFADPSTEIELTKQQSIQELKSANTEESKKVLMEKYNISSSEMASQNERLLKFENQKKFMKDKGYEFIVRGNKKGFAKINSGILGFGKEWAPEQLVKQSEIYSGIKSNERYTTIGEVEKTTSKETSIVDTDSMVMDTEWNKWNKMLEPVPTPSAISQRATTATSANQELKATEKMKSSTPVVVNSPTTNVVNNSTSGGGSSARIRNDDPVLTRVQYQNARPV